MSDFEARGKGLAPDRADAQVAQPEVVNAIACPGEDLQVRKVAAHDRRRFHGRLHVVDGEDEQPRLAGFRRVQKLGPGRVAVVDAIAVTPYEIDLAVVRFERGERDIAHAQDAGNDLAETAEP